MRSRLERLLLYKRYIDFLVDKELDHVVADSRIDSRRTSRLLDDSGDICRDEVVTISLDTPRSNING